jgi:integrase/recombinase XerD
MKVDSRLSQHVHRFFLDYLTTQRNVSSNTLLSYRDTIKLFLAFAARRLSTEVVDLNVDDLTAVVVLAFLDHLEQERGNGIATRNARLAALRTFYRHIGAHDPLSLEQCQRVVAIPSKRGRTKVVNYLERDELEAILNEIDRDRPEGRRDYAMLSLTYQTGARVSETLTVRACDLELEPPATVRLWGKGRKERLLPLWRRTAVLLNALLEERGVAPQSALPVFVNMRGRPMTRWGFRHVLTKYAAAAAKNGASGLTVKRIHPHLLRHSAAMHMLQSGLDPNVIRDVLGHASSETTWRYARLNLEMKRKAIESYAPTQTDEPPLWHRDKDLLGFLENLGKRGDYVKPIKR